MAFEQVLVVFPDGQQHGPIDWATLKTWVQQNRLHRDSTLVDAATQERKPLSSFAELTALPRAGGDEAVATLIPYKNKAALIAYYCGVFSLATCIPILGALLIPMSIAAVVLGFKGLKNVKANPEAHGTAHAWIGIVLGILCTLLGLLINVAAIAGLIANMNR